MQNWLAVWRFKKTFFLYLIGFILVLAQLRLAVSLSILSIKRNFFNLRSYNEISTTDKILSSYIFHKMPVQKIWTICLRCLVYSTECINGVYECSVTELIPSCLVCCWCVVSPLGCGLAVLWPILSSGPLAVYAASLNCPLPNSKWQHSVDGRHLHKGTALSF